ncbi:MAG: DUF3563 domain-containing protein [Burkholderiales bacterium]|nr:DUF3563 domain-containing protein [Burkholderiales bacterium]
MNARVPIYEGDGLLREALANAASKPAPERRAETPIDAFDPASHDLWAIERRAREMRAEAFAGLLSRFFGKIFGALGRWAERARQRDVERYLAKATDNADLERRLREIERTGHADPLGSHR